MRIKFKKKKKDKKTDLLRDAYLIRLIKLYIVFMLHLKKTKSLHIYQKIRQL